jgi:hypothetical protein
MDDNYQLCVARLPPLPLILRALTGRSGGPPNDLDVLVIGHPNRTEVYEAADRVERRLGLPVNPTVCSRRRWTSGTDAFIQYVRSSALAWVLDRVNLQGAA